MSHDTLIEPQPENPPITVSNTDCNIVASGSADSDLLGIIAESSSHGKKDGDPDHVDDSIRIRYRRLHRASVLLPNTRLAQCSWRPAPQAAYVLACFKPDDERSYYANLIQCDKPLCPICGFRRAEAVRHELSVALSQAQKMDYFPVMITATVQHHADDQLADLKTALATAWDKTFSGRWYDDLCAEYLIVGKTKSWEVTFGAKGRNNGFHPHIHALMFMSTELVGHWVDEFGDKLRERWIAQLNKLGYDASWAYGLDVTTANSRIAEYITKFGREPVQKTWGAETEIAMSAVKRSHDDGMTPFELLAAADGDPEALWRLSAVLHLDRPDVLADRAGRLFVEVFSAFERTAMVHWGKALWRALEMDEALAEYEANNPVDHDDVDMVMMEPDEWKKVLKLPDGRADLRAVVRTGDAFKVMMWLSNRGINGIVPPSAVEYSMAHDPPDGED